MVIMQPELVRKQLEQWIEKPLYIHLEVNPGAYWRNGRSQLYAFHIKGGGPYRLFLELDEGTGLIQVDQLTHMLVQEGQVICTGYDDQGRLARTIEISLTPFSMQSV